MRYELIYLLAGGTTAIVALVAIWAARSRVYWFWRAAAMLACFLLLVPVGAAELNLLFVPLAGVLFLASAGQQWWERRKKRASAKGGGEPGARESSQAGDSPSSTTAGPHRLPTSSVRFSLKELFLVILLAAVAAWVIARIVQEGILLDWRKLPIAVALAATVAWMAFSWADKPRPWRGTNAIPIAYLAGFVMAVVSIHALPYKFNWHSTQHIAIGSLIISVGTIAIVYLWLMYVGRVWPTIVLIAVVFGASYVHLHYIGDWLQADHLLVDRWPPFAHLWGVLYGFVYSLLAVFVILGVVLGRMIAFPIGESWRNRVVYCLKLAVLVAALVPPVWQYWRLLEVPQFKSSSTTSAINSLPKASEILLSLRNERDAAEMRAMSTGKWVSLHDSPQARQLYQELFAVLEHPGRVSRHWDTPQQEEAIQSQILEAWRLLNISADLLGRLDGPPHNDYDEWSKYALAWTRYANYSQRGALATEAWQGYAMETGGHIWLARYQDRLSPQCREEILAALRALDAAREPLSVMLDREAAWCERHERWRSRIQRVVLNKEDRSVDLIVRTRDMPSARSMHDRCLVIARLNMTEMAIEMYRQENARVPLDLRELVPRYLSAVPLDPHSGQPLVYRRTDDEYLLYSVGPDGEDDGGSVAGLEFQYQLGRYGYDGDIVLKSLIQELEVILARTPAATPAARAKAPPASQTGAKSPMASSP